MIYLIIPDMHHDIDWASKIIQKESFDHIIFLGDYFDKKRDLPSIKKVCEFLIDTKNYYKNDVTFLIGNHDASYLSFYFRNPFKNFNQFIHPLGCSSTNSSKLKKIRKYLPFTFIKEMKMGLFANEIFVSHAGLSNYILNETSGDIEKELILAKNSIMDEANHPFLWCGTARGGSKKKGGILWQDFMQEFEDDCDFQQIVGHTSRAGGLIKGNSICIDKDQTCYGILDNKEFNLCFNFI